MENEIAQDSLSSGNSQTINFGTLITISPHKMKKYISSDGFIEKSIQLQEIQIYQQIGGGKVQQQEQTTHVNANAENIEGSKPQLLRLNAINLDVHKKSINQDIYDGIFRIVPAFQWRQQEKLQEFLQTHQQPIKKGSQNYALLNKLREEYAKERDAVFEKFQVLKNQPLSYNQEFMLEHIKSRQFLAFDPNISFSLSYHGFRLILQENPNELTMFKIRPCYKYQQQISNQINFEEEIYILAVGKQIKKDAFLAATSQYEVRQRELTNLLQINNNNELHQQQQQIEAMEGQHCKDCVYLSLDRMSKFIIHLYRKEYDDNNVFFGNCVWLTYPEYDGYMLLQKQKSQGEEQQNNIQQIASPPIFHQQDNDESFHQYEISSSRNKKLKEDIDFNCFEDWKSLCIEKFEGNSIGMWTLETENEIQGSMLSFQQNFLLKNILTGYYMTLIHYAVKSSESQQQKISEVLPSQESSDDSFEEDNDASNFSITVSEIPTNYSLFFIENVIDQSCKKSVQNQSIFHIRNTKTGFYLGKSDQNNQVKIFHQKSQQDAFRFIKPQSIEIWETKFLLSCGKMIQKKIPVIAKISEMLQYKLEKNNQDISRQQVIDSLRIQDNGTNKLQNQIKQYKEAKSIKIIVECLKQLNKFCCNPIFGNQNTIEDSVIYEDFRKIIMRRKKMVHNQGFISFLAKLLHSCFSNEQLLEQLNIVDDDPKPTSYIQNPIDNAQSLNSFYNSTILSNKHSFNRLTNQNSMSIHQSHTILNQLHQTVQCCYEVIQVICHDHLASKLEVFNNIQYFFHHIGYIHGAIACLNECLLDNEDILKILIQKEIDYSIEYKKKMIMQNLIIYGEDRHPGGISERLEEDKDDIVDERKEGDECKQAGLRMSQQQSQSTYTIIHFMIERFYLIQQHSRMVQDFYEFLNRICVYREEGITINQLQIFYILQHNQYDAIFKQFTLEKIIQDSLLQQQSFVKKQTEIEKQLSLFANLCFGRNYTTKRDITLKFPKDKLIEAIWMNSAKNQTSIQMIPDRIRASLLLILLHVHIDSMPFFQQIIPLYTKAWNLESADQSQFDESRTTLINDASKQVVLTDNNSNEKQLNEQLIQPATKIQSGHKQSGSMPVNKGVNVSPLKDSTKVRTTQHIEMQNSTKKDNHEQNKEDIEFDDLLNSEKGNKLRQDLTPIVQDIIKYIETKNGIDQMNINLVLNMCLLSRKLITFDVFDLSQQPAKKQLINLISCFFNFLTIHISPSQQQQLIHQSGFLDYDNQFLSKNQNMRARQHSLWARQEVNYKVLQQIGINMESFMKQRVENEESRTQQIINQIRVEIVRMLIYFMDMKHNYILNQFVSLTKEILGKIEKNPASYSSKPLLIQQDFQNFLDYFFQQQNNNILDIPQRHIPNPANSQTAKSESDKQFKNTKKRTLNAEQQPIEFDFDLDSNYFSKQKFLDFNLGMLFDSSDPTLNILCLKLFFQSIMQRTNVISDLSRLQILTTQDEISVFQQMQRHKIQLLVDCEQVEVWLDKPEVVSQPSFAYKQNLHRVIDTITALICLCYGTKSTNIFDRMFYIIKQQKANTKDILLSRQIMLRNLQVCDVIVKLLQETSYIVIQIQQKNVQSLLLTTITEKCFSLLLHFIYNNNVQNKMLIYKHIDFFQQYLQILDYGQSELICEIFRNNKELLTFDITENLLRLFIQQIVNPAQHRFHIRYLEFLFTVLEYSGSHVRKNWHKVINIIIEPNILENILYLRTSLGTNREAGPFIGQDSNKNIDSFLGKKLITNENSQQSFFDFNLVNIDLTECQPYIYHYKVLKLINLLLDFPSKKQHLLKIMLKQNLNLQKVIEFLGTVDIFSIRICRQERYIALLNTLVKQEMYKLFNAIWLQDEHILKCLNQNSLKLLEQLFNSELSKLEIFEKGKQKEIEVSQFMSDTGFLLYEENRRQELQQSPSRNPVEQEYKITVQDNQGQLGNEIPILNMGQREKASSPNKLRGDKKSNHSQEIFRVQKHLCESIEIEQAIEADYLVHFICHIGQLLISLKQNQNAPQTNAFLYEKLLEQCQKLTQDKVMGNRELLAGVTRFYEQEQKKIEFFMGFTEIYQRTKGQDPVIQLELKHKMVYNNQIKELMSINPQEQERTEIQWREIILQVITNQTIYQQQIQKENEELLILFRASQFSLLLKKLVNFIQDIVQKNFNLNSLLQNEVQYIDDICVRIIEILCQILKDSASLLNHFATNTQLQSSKINPAFVRQNSIKQEYQKYMSYKLAQAQSITYKQVNSDQNSAIKNSDGVDGSNNEWSFQEGGLDAMLSAKEFLQSEFLKIGIDDMVIRNLCNPEIKDELFFAHIDLAIYLLDGGNLIVQNHIFQFFITNNDSENLFTRIKKLIQQEIEQIKKSETFNDIIDSSIKMLLKAHQHSSSVKDNNQDSYGSNITKILRFFQLLAEGHNIQLQNYMRNQFNSRHSYNFIILIVKLSEALLLNLSENNYFKLVQCFDTLAEFVQGPCEENQKNLIESKFLKITNIIMETNIKVCELIELNERQEQQQNILKKFQQYAINKKNENKFIPLETKKFIKDSQSSMQQQQQQQEPYFKKAFSSSASLTQEIFDCTQKNTPQESFIYLNQTILLTPDFSKISREFADKMSEILKMHEQNFEPWMIRRLLHKCLITLESILEGNKDQYNLKKISEVISIKLLVYNLNYTFIQYSKIFSNDYTNEVFEHFAQTRRRAVNTNELIIENGFKIFSLLKKYCAMFTNNKDLNNDFSQTKIKQFINDNIKDSEITQPNKINDVIAFFGQYTGYIEISRDSQIFKVHFPKLPYCVTKQMSKYSTIEDLSKNFEQNVDRSTRKNKLQGLMINSLEIIEDLKYQKSILEYKQLGKFGEYLISIPKFLSKYTYVCRFICSITCIGQNITLLIMVKKNHQFTLEYLNNQYQDKDSNGVDKAFLNIFQGIQIGVSFILLYQYTMTTYNKLRKQQVSLLQFQSQNMLSQYSQIIKKMLKDMYFHLRFFHMIFSILALFNIVFAVSLVLDIFFQLPLLRNILNSIWRPKIQILLTLLMYLIVQYVFSIVSYFFYYQDIQTADKKIVCDSLSSCFSVIMDTTFKANGGFSSLNGDQSYSDSYHINSKLIFDQFYTIIVLILLIQILSGIIIDTFAKIREEEEEKEKDRQNICFICGLNKKELDRYTNNDFQMHITQRHNIWNYLFYIAYIKDKCSTEFSGIESYVYKKFKDNDISWFPIYTQSEELLQLQKQNDDNEAQQIAALETIENRLDKLEKKIEIMNSSYQTQTEILTNKLDKTLETIEKISSSLILKRRQTINYSPEIKEKK